MAWLGCFGPKGLRLHFLQRGCAGRGGGQMGGCILWSRASQVQHALGQAQCILTAFREKCFFELPWTTGPRQGPGRQWPQFPAALTWSMHANVLSRNVTVDITQHAHALGNQLIEQMNRLYGIWPLCQLIKAGSPSLMTHTRALNFVLSCVEYLTDGSQWHAGELHDVLPLP